MRLFQRAFCAMAVLAALSCSITPNEDVYNAGLNGGDLSANIVSSYSTSYSSSSYSSFPLSTEGISFLNDMMDQYNDELDVYTDPDAAGNHFLYYAYMGTAPTTYQRAIMTNVMDVAHSGLGSIKITMESGSGWAGYYFQNGVLTNDMRQPAENWGDVPNAGFNLSGATKLTFWVKGAVGGEQVEFFLGGVGRNAYGTPIKPYPDSSVKVGTGTITLTSSWQQITLWVTGHDMSYTLGGFGWAAAQKGVPVVFYLDDIVYDLPRTNDARFILSYRTINSGLDVDKVLKNVAYVYDNAVALMAYVATYNQARAKKIADAIVYAQDNDRYFTDGRIRNAYKAGDLMLPPGWTPNGKTNTVAMPGWWDGTNWFEDGYCVGTSTGNVAWAILALLAYYQTYGGATYLNTAKEMGEWVEANVRDTRGAGGYTAGFDYWEGNQTNNLYKSTEHNLDLYSAFYRLYSLTGEIKWYQRATNARGFVMTMWDSNTNCFYTGTAIDGVTINKDNIPLDTQSWTLLSLRLGYPYTKSLGFAETNMKIAGTWGFDFNTDKDGIWYEGTGQIATAYVYVTSLKYWDVRTTIAAGKDTASGGWYACNNATLTTGFSDLTGGPWLYYHRLHIGATAWQTLAYNGINAFWLGTSVGRMGFFYPPPIP